MKKIFCSLVFLSSLFAEEGMWPFNMLPTQHIAEKYGVEIDSNWSNHVQRSCVRFSSGGSGSFVSKNGLVLTNHHVGATAIYNLSSQENDLMTQGFYAASQDQEIKCPNMYVDQLISIEDVTECIRARLDPKMTLAEQEMARKVVITEIENEALNRTGLQPQVVTLYHGGKYHLYLYRRYTDIRLVMAPEKGIAFFGGDQDNFEFPRFDLDMCFFRIYESGQPIQSNDYLQWSYSGPQEGEPLFVAGHPGSTDRMFTSSHLEFLRDIKVPLFLKWLKERKIALTHFSSLSEENRRIALQTIFQVDNSFKVWNGIYRGLVEQPIISKKIAYEHDLYGQPEQFEPWVKLKSALDKSRSTFPSYLVLEPGGLSLSRLFLWAKHLVRNADERGKSSEERLKEYSEADLPALELSLLSTEPIYLSLERMNLITGFERLIEILGINHPAVQMSLGGKTVEEKVDELLQNTQMQKISFRENLYSHPEEVKTSLDPLIDLAKILDPFSREIRKTTEDSLESVIHDSYTAIAALLFEKYGEVVYPDATFTLRLSMGTMKGYDQDGGFISPATTIGGAYLLSAAHDNQDPYELPPSWNMKESCLEETPFNFVSTHDIVGGNSGSPVINAKGELVGLIFDGNIQSLTWYYEFDETQGRSISVHSAGMLEALDKIYHASSLVGEIRAR
jgi:hypothetical protein